MSMTERFGQCFVKLRDAARQSGILRHVGAGAWSGDTQDIERLATESRGVDPAKRRQIIDGARRMFLAQGFDAASMGSIAREAGVSKGTLYVYFKSKEELFEAIVEEQCRQQAEQIFNFEQWRATGSRAEAALAMQFARFLCRPGGVSPLRTVIAIADRMPELGAKFYQSGPAAGIASLKRLSRGQGRGRHPRAARLRGGRSAIHRLVPVDNVQADAVQLRRPTGRTRASSTSSIWRCTHSLRHTRTADLPPTCRQVRLGRLAPATLRSAA